MTRIVFIWHAAVVPAYRKLLEELYPVSGADLHLIVPRDKRLGGCGHGLVLVSSTHWREWAKDSGAGQGSQ